MNAKFLGTISIAIDARGDGEIDAQRLIALLGPVVEAKLLAALTARIAGRTRVDFADLAVDGFALRFDNLALEIIATLPPDASKPATLQLGPQQDVPVPASFDQPSNFSAGVNIAASQRYVYGAGGGFQPIKADFDAIANFGGFSGVTFTGGVDYDGARWQREEFRATHDMFGSAVRATLGEFTPSSTSFQGVGRILGFGVERAYSTIRPFQNTRPTGRQDFTLDHDSSVDVLVNNIRVQTIRLAAGRYNISDFPFAAGPNQVQLIVEDIGGRREILNFDVFNTSNLLTSGLTEFGAAVGLREREQLHYGSSPGLTGYLYHGMSDTLTLGVNAQATSDGVQLGGVVVLGTPIGFFQLEGSGSRRFPSGDSGVAASLDYRGDFSIRQKDDLRIVGSAVYRSATFQDAFSQPLRNPHVVDTALQVQWLAPLQVSTGLGASYSLARDGGADSYRLDLTLGRSFGRLGISATGSRTVYQDGRNNDDRVAVGLSLLLGRRDSVNARYDSGTGRAEVEVARAPEGRLDEVSGSIRYTQDRDANALSGRLAYVNNRFDLVLNHNRIESAGPDGQTSNASDWNIRTFIGYADGSIGIGRAVDEGFVVAPLHSTLRGAQASIVSGDRVIAQSGLFGPAVVPIGRAYSIQHYDVKVDPLPIGYDLGAAEISIFPGYGSGYRSMIGSDASHIVIGFLATDDGPVSLASGIIEPIDPALKKNWKERGFFTNRAGRFVADRLAPGRYRLLLDGKVAAEIEVTKDTEGVVDVGKLRVAR
uniref:hypothetical protein n=1 Tax=uncultured Sphingomonas sp. TaxID=158754 RepID=UPI0035CC8D72